MNVLHTLQHAPRANEEFYKLLVIKDVSGIRE